MVLLAGKMDVSLTWRTFSNQQALDRAVENGEVDISPGMLQTPASLHHWLFSQPICGYRTRLSVSRTAAAMR
jgi:hypothetical protein